MHFPLIQNRQSKIQNYLITLSARANTFGGIVNPICFAVFRLITNSNFVGCSTGRSPALAPFRILSIHVSTQHPCRIVRPICRIETTSVNLWRFRRT